MATQTRSPSGYSAWRLIADDVRREIVDGALPAGARLPSETELAERFGVHRNTVRQAVAALAADQLVVARRGSGTFVAEHAVLVHRIGLRTRLTSSLEHQGGAAPGRLLSWAVEAEPPAEVSERLGLDGRPALHLESVRRAGGVAISRGTHWFDAGRVEGLHEQFSHVGSMTEALRAVGVDDYVRASTMVGARVATPAEASDLQLAAGSVVLVVRAVDALPDGTPLQYGVTRFRADRVELDVETQR
jgi:GntR family transcriptional regulator, phosphonate transport system regulatory protein